MFRLASKKVNNDVFYSDVGRGEEILDYKTDYYVDGELIDLDSPELSDSFELHEEEIMTEEGELTLDELYDDLTTDMSTAPNKDLDDIIKNINQKIDDNESEVGEYEEHYLYETIEVEEDIPTTETEEDKDNIENDEDVYEIDFDEIYIEVDTGE